MAPLMRPFAPVVLDELRDGSPEVAFSEGDDPIETLFFDRPYESLRVGIGIRRAEWRLDHVQAGLG